MNGIESRVRSRSCAALLSAFIAVACGGKSSGAEPDARGGGGDLARGDASAGGHDGGGSSSVTGGSSSVTGGSSSVMGGSSSVTGGSSSVTGGGGTTAGDAPGGAGTSSVPMTAGEGGGAGAAECLDVCAREGEACCFAGGECVSPSGQCTIEVLAGLIDTSNDYDVIAQRVAALSPERLLSLGDADVASARIEAPFAARLELVLSAEASVRAADLEQAERHPFRVSCGGRELFIGVVYAPYGAAAIGAPVMHVSRNPDERLVLRVGAWQGAWAGPPSTTPETEQLRQRFDRPELRAALCRDGSLTAL